LTLQLQIKFSPGQYLPRAMGGWLTAHFLTHLFYQGHYLPCGLPHHISRGHCLPRGGRGWVRGGGLQLISQPINFIMVTIYPAALFHNVSRGHYLSCKSYCLVLACIKAIFQIRPLSFCHDFSQYTIIQLLAFYFEPGDP
jgi:hypothetical protein